MSSDYLNYDENLAFPPQDTSTPSSHNTPCQSSSDLIRGSQAGKGSPDRHADTGKTITVDKEVYNSILNNNTKLFIETANLRKKLATAVDAINMAAAFLTCMDDLSETTGVCNEQAALDALNKALEDMKE